MVNCCDAVRQEKVMHHFFVKGNQIEEKRITLIGDDAKHLWKALRGKVGERILISGDDGLEYTCEISQIGDEKVEAEILWKEAADRELPVKIHLFQGLPKGDKMEWVIQKAVELGAYEIIPVATKRSVVKLDEKKGLHKRERWQAIAESAAKQSKRAAVPEVKGPVSFGEAVQMAKELDMILFPYELAEGMEYTRDILNQVKNKRSVGIFIGPEGGFDENEVNAAKQEGACPITLGKRILRTETAGLYLLSVLGYLLEE